ncbi:MAG: AMP-binding protein, partial [Pseudomonadota bacterium]
MRMADVKPISNEEFKQATEAVLARGAPFEVAPMTIRGVEYPSVFTLSNLSLREVLAIKAVEHADTTIIVYDDERYTFGEVWKKSLRFANWLHAEGYGPGDRIA